MREVREFHRRAVEAFTHRVSGIAEQDWSRPSPCDAWTVRDLVNHVVAEELWVRPLLDGETTISVGDRFDGDVLGPVPIETAASAAAEAIAASDKVDLEKTVHLSFGDFAARFYLEQLFADHVVHTWDLCVSIGAEFPIEDDLVDACATWFENNEESYRAAEQSPRDPGAICPAGDYGLLVMFGRDPGRTPVSP